MILGSTGEAIFVRNSERAALISSQRKTLDDAGFKDCPIIAGTATQNIDDTIEMVKESKDAGAEYAMVRGILPLCYMIEQCINFSGYRFLDQHTSPHLPAKQVSRSGSRL